MSISLIILIDGSFKISLLIFIGLPDVQEEIIVRSQNVEDLVSDVDEKSVDSVPVHSVGHLEALRLPGSEFVVHSLQELLFPTTQTHRTQLYYNTQHAEHNINRKISQKRS